MEGTSRHFGSLIVERSNEGRDGLFVDQAIEEVDTEPPHDGLSMLKTPLDGWQRGWT